MLRLQGIEETLASKSKTKVPFKFLMKLYVVFFYILIRSQQSNWKITWLTDTIYWEKSNRIWLFVIPRVTGQFFDPYYDVNWPLDSKDCSLLRLC